MTNHMLSEISQQALSRSSASTFVVARDPIEQLPNSEILTSFDTENMYPPNRFLAGPQACIFYPRDGGLRNNAVV